MRRSPYAGDRCGEIGWYIEMRQSRSGKDGTYITRRVGKGSHVVKTIVTPAGSFRTMSKDVFDRALRSANSRLQQIGNEPVDAHGNARKR